MHFSINQEGERKMTKHVNLDPYFNNQGGDEEESSYNGDLESPVVGELFRFARALASLGDMMGQQLEGLAEGFEDVSQGTLESIRSKIEQQLGEEEHERIGPRVRYVLLRTFLAP